VKFKSEIPRLTRGQRHSLEQQRPHKLQHAMADTRKEAKVYFPSPKLPTAPLQIRDMKDSAQKELRQGK
jgi:hypothetical protein